MNTRPSNVAFAPVATIHLSLLGLFFLLGVSFTQGQTTTLELKPMPEDEVVAQPALRDGGCAPATALRDLEWNNVRTLIENGGTLWHERATFRGSYIVPKEGGVSTVFAGALWIGGVSPDQQLKIAATMHRRNGKNDFWPGPLTTDGAAEVSDKVCSDYDRFFISERVDAQRHRQWFDAQAEGTAEEDFPEGYSMPTYFREYPAHGDDGIGQDYYLAPFKDYDGDGYYNPDNGDYPWYDFCKKSTAPIGSERMWFRSMETKPTIGFSTTKGTFTPSPKGSPSAWKSVRRPLRFRPTTRSTT